MSIDVTTTKGAVGPALDAGRNETSLERCDRNLAELLQEVRVIQTGVQVLFAFLLAAPLTTGFRALETATRVEYYVTLTFTGAAAVLLIAPTAYHRVLFRLGEKEYLVTVANRFTIAGISAVGLAMVGAMVLVTSVMFGNVAGVIAGAVMASSCLTLWAALPTRRRRSTTRRAPAGRSAP
jgi:hypothetical protein